MQTSKVTVLAVALTAGLILGVSPAGAKHHRHDNGSITVVGTATVAAKPDVVRFQVGAVNTEPTATAALAANNQILSELQAELIRFQIADGDFQTARFDVSPQYRRSSVSSSSEQELAGYRVNHVLTVTLRDIERLGELLDALITAGANVLSGISFSIGQPDSLLAEGRRLAVADAREKAQTLADAAGIKLGRVRKITEGSASAGGPVLRGGVEMAALSVPVASGEQQLVVNVTVSFAIMRPQSDQ